MIQLKAYQQRTLDELRDFLADTSKLLTSTGLEPEKALRLMFLQKDEEISYRPIPDIVNTPYLCIKIPTGGGKTLVACHSLPIILDTYLQDKNGLGLVLWMVPSDAIKSQTLTNLQDRNHPYREALDEQFGNNVKVLSLEEALSIQPADLQNNLCIVVASLQAFRRTDKQWLKVFQNNGSLLGHFENLVENTDFLEKDEEGTIVYSLGNVIKINSPIVIVDEGHNAQTALSFDMLRLLNPSLILEHTATPRSESNVLVNVTASELKAEKMVKIPIYLENLTQWQEAIRDGVTQRAKLEKLAADEKKRTKEYIRPIALIQAEQEKESDEKIFVGKIKDFLLDELKISADEIAIKTATNDEIKGIDLLSPKSPIRYILTVNALKEGWDCPFAYVLISVANIGAKIAVEQTMGRILRLPKAQEKQNLDLNYSYVYTSSESFSKASSAIIQGLETNGYSKADLRENKGKVVAEKTEFERVIKDNETQLPYLSLKDSGQALSFARDLIGMRYKIYEHFVLFSVDFHDDQNQKLKIDVTQENRIYREVQGRLVLVFNTDDFSTEELAGWLKREVRSTIISSSEMNAYIDKVLVELTKTYTVEILSLNRYRLKEAVGEQVQQLLNAHAKQQFEQYLNGQGVSISGECFSPPATISLARMSDEHFRKHLFERAGYMNGEETDFAMRLDVLENVAWWYRNREKLDFYLQGWKPGKFYPDFIVKTTGGNYLLIEYKGEDRLSNEDTAYKQEIGNLWQHLNKDYNRFYLVGRISQDAILKELQSIT